ncbi:hypothetical protein VE01_04646 [Pseudogymnoascus verrucosus]|uniref:Uncharacterized protein n=1 Tax=Pseudogymnoascus verrucosus TaxID=342668 RepID=A0A1B8GN05_9PEZI|nr:uncharacterized protein VE01_04646 [Pseudogymnoascus verrucosus]OBT97209.1 hypothetical protein VE01_04646 [Pseudogymnoascus verrucosus]
MLPQPHYFQTKHIIEFQGMNTFFHYLSNRTIVPGTTLAVTPYDFFTQGFNSEIIPTTSPLITPVQSQTANLQIPSDRIMEALGSTWNHGNFVLLRDTINGAKSRLWAGVNSTSDDKMNDAVRNKPGTALSYIRRVIAVTHYLNSPILVMIEDVWQAPGPNRDLYLSDSWEAFISYQMPKIVERANKFADDWLRELERVYNARPANDPDKALVLQNVRTLDVYRVEMVATGLHVAGYP